MKRKAPALALAAVTLLLLAACGGQDVGSDLTYVQTKGSLIVGITTLKPLDYQDESGAWVGFDADLTRAFAKSLGVEPIFQEIDWGSKARLLDERDIDVVWNGMTLTDAVREQMSVSAPYCRNAQVVVTSGGRVEFCRTEDSLRNLDILADGNSTGAKALDDIGIVYTPVSSQHLALSEVADGSADACVIDLFMATASTGPGSDYPHLTIAMELGDDQGEEIAVGFRRNSDLTDAFAQFWADAQADGTVAAAAQTYGMTPYLLEP